MSNVPTQQPDDQGLPPTRERMDQPLDAMEQVNPLLPTLEEQREIIDDSIAQGHLNWLKGQEGNQRYLYPDDPNTNQERVFFMPPQTIFWIRDQLEIGANISPQSLYDKLMADTTALGEEYAFLPARYEKFKADFVATEDKPVVLDEVQQAVFENFLQDVVVKGIKSNELYGKSTIDLLAKILDPDTEPSHAVEKLQIMQTVMKLLRESKTIETLMDKLSQPVCREVKEILISAHKHWREFHFPTNLRTSEGIAALKRDSAIFELRGLVNPTAKEIIRITNDYRDQMHQNSEFSAYDTFQVMFSLGTHLEKLSNILKESQPQKADAYKDAAKEMLATILSDANPIIIESAIKFIREKRPQLMPES